MNRICWMIMVRYTWTVALLLGWLASFAMCQSSTKIEPWADPNLPVQANLVAWYDASRLAEGSSSQPTTAIKAGELVRRWPDASGHQRDLLQVVEQDCPSYEVVDGLHLVRFDGRRSHLRWPQAADPLAEMTLFIVSVPYSNSMSFSGWLASAAAGQNDYVSGFNLDMGPFASNQLNYVNVEGQGQGGAESLFRGPIEFGNLVRMCVTSGPGPEETSLWVNGQPEGRRQRQENTTIRFDEFVVGARFYNNAGAPLVQGFFEGDIAEVILFDRMLSARERTDVERYLASKYNRPQPLPKPNFASFDNRLVRVENPPAIQMLVPGFEVRELPIELTNVNNLLYRADGHLVALAYDGNVYLLRDTNQDGLEDTADKFWDNQGQIRGAIGMDLAPPSDAYRFGVIVASKGKCSMIVDVDGDDRADREIILAQGWTELPHGVDALGVAVDRKRGDVYFGLGVQDFTNAYGVGPPPASPYKRSSERAAILRVDPKTLQREIVATGIRFPVGIRFNALGDLFCTDQEGATWLPNGNPFDELLHVQMGRHYGFPPRHPQLLPDVIDEPSVFDYGPQHQSTCGLNFNTPTTEVFGPEWWRGDAILVGYSRGKLYRTKLVKTEAGYVAQNQLIACLSMLPADVCISEQGEAVIAVHSGGPDWGSGPTGLGKLFKVRTLPETPRPVMAWTSSSREVQIAFDRPLDGSQLAGLSDSISIEYGTFVSAGDRFESQWPGYKAVHDQFLAPRRRLPVHSVQISPDRRHVILGTSEHDRSENYVVTMRGMGRPARSQDAAVNLSQYPETDIAYDLAGVEATFVNQRQESEKIWLPHADLDVAQALTIASAQHQAFWNNVQSRGTLELRTMLDLRNMLRPEVQPGSRIDYELPKESVTIQFEASVPLSVQIGDERKSSAKDANGRFVVKATVPSQDRLPVVITMATSTEKASLHVSWSTAEDATWRAFPLRRFLQPWVPVNKLESEPKRSIPIAELAGGNWARGKSVFLSQEAACAKCHRVGGDGARIGPDLTNLPKRDYQSVLRDIENPNWAINPDHITQSLLLAGGRIVTGVVRTDGDRLLVSDEKGTVQTILKDEVEEQSQTGKSIMPEGIPKLLGPDKMRDLMTFLLTEPPSMPDYGPMPPPEPRTQTDVDDALAGSEPIVSPKPIKIVLVYGPKDHGPGEHDYPAWQESWSRLLAMADGVHVETVLNWPSSKQLDEADVLVFYQQGTWTDERAKDLDAFLARGRGVVYLHYAVDGGADAPGFAQRIGLAWQGGRSKFRHGLLDVGFQLGASHPIARNLQRLAFVDESYWQLVGDRSRIAMIGEGTEDAEAQPLFWTTEAAGGRVFVSILGHYAWTFDDPLFRIILLRGIAWAGQQPVDRFNDLVTPGARIAK